MNQFNNLPSSWLLSRLQPLKRGHVRGSGSRASTRERPSESRLALHTRENSGLEHAAGRPAYRDFNDDLRKIHHRRQLRPIAQHTAIMATELTVQSERAFQKQPHVFQNNKKQGGKTKRAGKGGRRWVKDVGLGFRTPRTAIEGNYIGE
jgi:hypothetical protein